MGSLVPFRRLPRFTPGEIRLTLLGGAFMGLVGWQTMAAWSPAAVTPDSVAAMSAAPIGAYNAPGAERSYGPVRVIDGDTFDHNGVRIRIADIDTPEIRGRCPQETALAARATQRMRTLLTAGPFDLHPLANGRDKDHYGRKLRIVTRGGRSLGDVLVAEGLARTWSGRREPWCT
jgi:micrococcal nuclease